MGAINVLDAWGPVAVRNAAVLHAVLSCMAPYSPLHRRTRAERPCTVLTEKSISTTSLRMGSKPL